MTRETMVDPAELAAVDAAFPSLEQARAVREAVDGATQEWLGLQCGVDSTAVSHWEAGRRRAAPHHRIKWFRVLVQLERLQQLL